MKLGGLGSLLPDVSTALTINVLFANWPGYSIVAGLVQVENGELSRLHSKVAIPLSSTPVKYTESGKLPDPNDVPEFTAILFLSTTKVMVVFGGRSTIGGFQNTR